MASCLVEASIATSPNHDAQQGGEACWGGLVRASPGGLPWWGCRHAVPSPYWAASSWRSRSWHDLGASCLAGILCGEIALVCVGLWAKRWHGLVGVVLAQECRLVVAKECMRGSARWDSGSVGFFLTRWLGRGDGAI